MVIVVITPNLNKGTNDENIKLKKPIAVVKEVIKTGIPIFSNWYLKDLNLFSYNLSEFNRCIKSEIVIIKTIGVSSECYQGLKQVPFNLPDLIYGAVWLLIMTYILV